MPGDVCSQESNTSIHHCMDLFKAENENKTRKFSVNITASKMYILKSLFFPMNEVNNAIEQSLKQLQTLKQL